MFWKASVLEKTEGNKDFPYTAKLKVIPGKPSVLFWKKSKQNKNRTEGNKGTPYFQAPSECLLYILKKGLVYILTNVFISTIIKEIQKHAQKSQGFGADET